MRYLSVCSGIGTDALAWHPLGWECAAFAEVDRQASTVLAHQFPDTQNLGNLEDIGESDVGPIDLVVGGTPCQDFSVAGLRAGLDGARGNLTLEFVRLLDRLRPGWFVWENVPGVLSDNGGRTFGAILGAMVSLGYGVAWRCLDSQYIRVESHPRAVPQRRRRVFVVGHIGGDWRPPFGVLVEPESLRRDSPPRRQSRQDPTGAAAVGFGGGRTGGPIDVAPALLTHGVHQDFETEALICQTAAPPLTGNPYGDHESREGLLVAHTLRGEGHDAGEDGTGRGTPLVVTTHPGREVAGTMTAHHRGKGGGSDLGTDFRLDGGLVPVAIQGNASNPIVSEDGACPTMDTKAGKMAVAVSLRGRDGGNMAELGEDVSPALRTAGGGADKQYVLTARAFAENMRGEVRFENGDGQVAGALSSAGGGKPGQGHPTIIDRMHVRRITPLEAERLQGLPDNWTAVRYRGRPMADGPRYRLIGNGMSVNVMRWLGERIAMMEDVLT